MAEPRTSSAGRNLPSFQKESEKNPSGFQPSRSPNGHRDGYGRGTGGVTKNQQLQEQSRQRFLVNLKWAEQNLPKEHGPFAAVAYGMESRSRGRDATTEEVFARLKVTGRDRDAVNAQAKRYGQKEPLA